LAVERLKCSAGSSSEVYLVLLAASLLEEQPIPTAIGP
jgi:hypothetical protein